MSNSDYVNIPITLNSDAKGYFDRQCPNDECEYIFKINMEDWKEKVSDDEVHCPMCGHINSSDKWYTENQIHEIRKVAMSFASSYIQKELSKSFKKLQRSTRNNKYVKVEFKPGRRLSFVNNPIGQLEEWQNEVVCSKCSTGYSVIGMAYFCPCCGYYAIEDIFNESLDTIIKMISSIMEMKQLFEQQYGTDKSETMGRALIEGTLGDIVSAFQKFAETNFSIHSSKTVRPNDFQIVDKGSKLYEDEFGSGYGYWLTEEEIGFMILMFQRRHIVEHNSGMVDKRYLEKSMDSSYEIGQRLIIKKEDIEELIRIIRKLGDGLKTIKKKEVI